MPTLTLLNVAINQPRTVSDQQLRGNNGVAITLELVGVGMHCLVQTLPASAVSSRRSELRQQEFDLSFMGSSQLWL
jgi:hypothetical protein